MRRLGIVGFDALQFNRSESSAGLFLLCLQTRELFPLRDYHLVQLLTEVFQVCDV